MDDKTFDLKTAADWIEIVESEIGRVRNTDIYPLLNTWVNSVAPYEILEIGAGQGICSENIDLNGRNYIGVDPSPFLIERANELYCHPNRRFLRGTVYDLPFSASAFDAAFSIAVWHLLERLQTATSELSRVLKDNGHFLIITANPGAYFAWTELYRNTKLDGRRFEGTAQHPDGLVSRDVLYLHSLDEIAHAFETAHCTVEGIETFRALDGSAGEGKFVLVKGHKRPSIGHSQPVPLQDC